MNAKLCRFYGISPIELAQMTYEEALLYYQAIDKVEASEMFVQLTISDYPHMKKESRRKVYKDIEKIVHRNDKPKTISNAEFARMAGAWRTKDQG